MSDKVADSFLMRQIKGVSSSLQSSVGGYLDRQRIKYMHRPTERSAIDLRADAGSRRVSANEFAKRQSTTLKTQMLANEIIYQDQNAGGIVLRLSIMDTIFSSAFILNIMSASVIAWVFSRDSENVVSEKQDEAFLALFFSILFTLTMVLFLENLVSNMRQTYLDFADMFSLYIAKSIETTGALFMLFHWWMKVTRWNFYITAIGLFFVHMGHNNKTSLEQLPDPLRKIMLSVFDMTYVRKSTVLDPYAEKPHINTVAVLAQMLGFYSDKDKRFVNVLFHEGSITDTDQVKLSRPSAITTENAAGKVITYAESNVILNLNGTTKTVFRATGLYLSGILAADTIYKYTIENAFYYMPQRVKAKSGFKIF